MGSSDCALALWCRNTFGHLDGRSVTCLLRPIGALGSSNCTAILGRRAFLFFSTYLFVLPLALGRQSLCVGLRLRGCSLTAAAPVLREASAAVLARSI